ncbi:hypothetical protein ACFZAS_17285 [Streptomyces lavendulae]|uniref:hypothetical protein n=1 Tax=Streptomyces lavendulae TaxID=1914 RepID=UPI0036E7547B
MSTPEEQQRAAQEDPYGTQTWQSDTWDTSYQPVQRPLGSVPGQPVAPEGWFRDEAQAAPQAPPPAQQQWAAPAGAAPWPDATGAGAGAGAAEQTAYLPPVQQQPQPQQPQQPQGQQQPVVPEGWFRDEAPQAPQAPARSHGRHAAPWQQQAPAADAAAETAYLPPVREQAAPQTPWPGGPGAGADAAAETAYLPPVREQAAPQTPWPGGPGVGADAAAETAYLPPVRDSAAEQTAYLPPVQAQPQPQAWDTERTAYLPPVTEAAAERTAYLPPQPPAPDAAAERTAYLPPVPSAAAAPQASATAPAPASAPASGPAGPDAEYSPPTLGGNTLRAVDPAQARAEGRSPIIDPGPQSAILTAALGLLLAGAAAFGSYALLLPLIALQALTAAGWFRLNGMWPARQGIALAFAGAVVADGAVLAVDEPYGPGAIIGTLGAWVLLTLVLQLRSHADPDERMYGLMASVASAALAIVCAGFLAADGEAVSVGAAAVAVAVFARALPLPTVPSVGVSLAAAAGAGIAVGGLTGIGAGGALLGLAAGVCALVGLRVAAYDYPSKFVHMTAGVALPLAVAAPAVYLLGRVVG